MLVQSIKTQAVLQSMDGCNWNKVGKLGGRSCRIMIRLMHVSQGYPDLFVGRNDSYFCEDLFITADRRDAQHHGLTTNCIVCRSV